MKYFFLFLCLFSLQAQKLSLEEMNRLAEEIYFPEGNLSINLDFTPNDFEENPKLVSPEKHRKTIAKYTHQSPRSFQEYKELAEAYQALGDRENALKHYAAAEKIYRDSVGLYENPYSLVLGYSEILLSLGYLNDAYTLLQRLTELTPDSARIYYTMASVFLMQRKWNKARELTYKAIEKNKPQTDFSHYVSLAVIQLLENMEKIITEKSRGRRVSFSELLRLEEFAPASEVYPDKTKLLQYTLELSGMLMDEFINSPTDPRKFRGTNKNSPAYTKLLKIEKYCIKMTEGKFRKQPYLFNMLQVTDFLKYDIPATYDYYKKYISLNPYKKVIYYNQAFIYTFTENYSKALQIIQEKQKYLPGEKDKKILALLYFKAKQYDKTLQSIAEISDKEYRKLAEFCVEVAKKNYVTASKILGENPEQTIVKNKDKYYYFAIKSLIEGNREKAREYILKDQKEGGSLGENLKTFIK